MRIREEQAGELFVIWNYCIVPENKLINNAVIKILNLPPVSNYGRPVPPSCGKTNPWFTPNYAGIHNRRLHEPPFNPQLCSPAIEPTQNGLTFTVDRKTQFHPQLWSTPETYANKDPTPGLKTEANGLVLPGSPPSGSPGPEITPLEGSRERRCTGWGVQQRSNCFRQKLNLLLQLDDSRVLHC